VGTDGGGFIHLATLSLIVVNSDRQRVLIDLNRHIDRNRRRVKHPTTPSTVSAVKAAQSPRTEPAVIIRIMVALDPLLSGDGTVFVVHIESGLFPGLGFV